MAINKDFIMGFGAGKAAGGGGSSPTGTININANGTHNVKDYASANVAVPNSYAAADEGKVVSNGALVGQTSQSITENGTYDTTTKNEVVVDVQGGGGTLITKTITSNGTYDASSDSADGYSQVTVNVEGGGGGGGDQAEWKDVNFIDYDGSVLYSYTTAEALALNALPANPSHSGLTAQGWNYTLAQVKTECNATGKCVVGQMYVTDDGKTRIYIELPIRPRNRLLFYVRFKSSVSNNVTLDWGDGTVETVGSTTTTSYSHSFTSPGKYVITLKVNSGSITFDGANNYAIYGMASTSNNAYIANRARIKKIEFGNGIDPFDAYICYNCQRLESVTIPSTITRYNPSNTFSGCYGLKAIVLPSNATDIGTSTFASCNNLEVVSIPPSVTTISSGFQTCYNLGCIVIPSTVTSLGSNAFASDVGTGEYYFNPTTPPAIASNTFYNIMDDTIFYVPYSADHSILDAYKTATNWSSYASRIQEAPAVL